MWAVGLGFEVLGLGFDEIGLLGIGLRGFGPGFRGAWIFLRTAHCKLKNKIKA